jgi:hypothetical protein
MAHIQPQGVVPDHPPLSDVIERNIQNQAHLRIEAADDPHSDLAQLEMETKPEDVLAEIQRLRQLEHPVGGSK